MVSGRKAYALVFSVFLAFLTMLLSGCSDSEEKAYAKSVKSGIVEEYIHDKYGFEAIISDIHYRYIGNLFRATLSSKVEVNCKGNNSDFTVLVDAYNKKVIGDNYELNLSKKDLLGVLRANLPSLDLKEYKVSIALDDEDFLPLNLRYKGDLAEFLKGNRFTIDASYYIADKNHNMEECTRDFITAARKAFGDCVYNATLKIVFEDNIQQFLDDSITSFNAADPETIHAYANVNTNEEPGKQEDVIINNFVDINDLFKVCIPNTECRPNDFTVKTIQPDEYKDCSDYEEWRLLTDLYSITYNPIENTRLYIKLKKNYSECDEFIDSSGGSFNADVYNLKEISLNGLTYYNTTHFIDNGSIFAVGENIYKRNLQRKESSLIYKITNFFKILFSILR